MVDEPVSEAEKAYARMDARLAIANEVVRLFEKLEAEGKMTQSRLARRLGVSRSRISKLLTGRDNWTLDTVADLLAGMDARLTVVEAKPCAQIVRRNWQHDWLAEPVAPRAG